MNKLHTRLQRITKKINEKEIDICRLYPSITECREIIGKYNSDKAGIVSEKLNQLCNNNNFFSDIANIKTDLVPESICWVDIVYDFLKANDLYNANCTIQYIKKEKIILKKRIVDSYLEYFRQQCDKDYQLNHLFKAISELAEKLDKEITLLNEFSFFIYKVNKFVELTISEEESIDRNELKSKFNNMLTNSERRIDGQIFLAVNFNSIDDYLAYIISCSYFFDPKLVWERHSEIFNKYIHKEPLPARRQKEKDTKHYYSRIPNRENVEIERDKDGNNSVRQLITEKTGVVVSQGSSANNFVNYVISHVWDNAGDERFLTNFWNIALIPAWANVGMDKADESDFISVKLKKLIQRICVELYGMNSLAYSWEKMDLGDFTFADDMKLNSKYTTNIIHARSSLEGINIDSMDIDFRYKIVNGNLLKIFPDKALISKLTIPDNVTSIGNDVNEKDKLSDKSPLSIFNNNDCFVRALEIPSSVKTIKNCAFYYFTHLENITFHEGLKTIEANAFRRTIGYASKNYELHFPKSLESIGDYAFDQCGLSKVYLNSTVSCGTGAFPEDTILHFYDKDTEVIFKDYKGL